MKRLIIISGLSGAGKSVALHTLEDAGFYCIDNMPLELIKLFVRNEKLISSAENIAISIDVRSLLLAQANQLRDVLAQIRKICDLKVVYITASEQAIAQRYLETRRAHPLMSKHGDMLSAIKEEIDYLLGIAQSADFTINTSTLNQHELRYQIRTKILPTNMTLHVLIQSFGFKYAIPPESSFVLDVRCLPNPYWEQDIQALNGEDAKVIEYLDGQEVCNKMFGQLQTSISDWIKFFIQTGKEDMVVSIGCTGGQHRSVYMANRLYHALEDFPSCRVSVRHTHI